MAQDNPNQALIDKLNDALAWELRAQVMYAHFAAYVRGIARLQLQPHFQGEADESVAHGGMVRLAIVTLGGVAVTDRASDEIVHTTDYRIMLREALATEKQAAATYEEVLALIKDDDELYDNVQQICFAEVRSVAELQQLID